MATIVTKNSSTATSVPSSSDLVEGELAVNTADKRLFTENNSATVIELGINPSSLTTGVISATSVTSSGAIQGTVVTATTNFAGPITGAVTGNVTGDVTGNLTGNVTGNITGTGTSSLTTLGTTNLTAGGITFVTSDGSPNQVLGTTGSGALQWLTTAVYDLASQAEAEAGTVTTGRIFSPLRVKQAIDALATTAGADIASATAVDLTAATGNTVVITGTTESTSLTMNSGQQMILLPSGAWPLTYHATTMNINGGVSYTCAAGDRIYAVKDLAGVIRVSVFKQDGTAVVGGVASSVAVGDITGAGTGVLTALAVNVGSAGAPVVLGGALGTPSGGTLTNATGLPISTGVSGLATNVATFLGTSSSANLASAVTDETGSGALVFGTSPTFVTPVLGTPSSGTATNLTGLPISTGVSGLATGVATFLGTSSSANLASAVTDETGSGSLVFATSPTFVTPVLGTPASGTATNLTGLPPAGVTGTAAILGANTFTGLQTQSAGADIASATATDLTAATGNVVVITGTTTATSLTMTKGQQMTLIAAAAWPLTFHATTMNITGGASYTCAAGDRLYVVKDDDDVIRVSVLKQDGTAVVAGAAGGVREFTATGTIADGIIVTLESDGTVKATTQSIGTPTAGTPTTFEADEARYMAATYDSNTNRVVIAYEDDGYGDYGTAIVGTVSGDTITFGTAVVYQSSATQYTAITFDSNENRVVISYEDQGNSNYGTAIVGTVTGGGTNSISFGTAVVYESADSRQQSITFDSNSNKAVLQYQDRGNSQYGTAIVGTVSGTAISFGTAVVFNSAYTIYMSATFDSNENRVVIAYQDRGNPGGYYGTAIVGTVSGTAISFGTAVVFESAATQYIGSTFDSSTNRVVIAYQDNDNSNYGTAIVGTVSGTAISFGTAVVFESASTVYISATFDSAASRAVIAYIDEGNSDYGTVIQGTVSGTDISFGSVTVYESSAVGKQWTGITFDPDASRTVIAYQTTASEDGEAVTYGSDVTTDVDNEIGIAAEAGTDGNPIDVTILGGVNASQSGLTIAAEYWAAGDGTLSASDTGHPKMGIALSATELLIKGDS